MGKQSIVIFGTCAIGRSIGLLLAEYGALDVVCHIGSNDPVSALQAARWINEGNTNGVIVQHFSYNLKFEFSSEEMISSTIAIINCLPNESAAPFVNLARKISAHYVSFSANACEQELAFQNNSKSRAAILLEAGISPGFFDFLLNDLQDRFRSLFFRGRVCYNGIRLAVIPRFGMYDCEKHLLSDPFQSYRESILINSSKDTNFSTSSVWETCFIDGEYLDISTMARNSADLFNSVKDRFQQNYILGRYLRRNAKFGESAIGFDWILIQTIVEGRDMFGGTARLVTSCRIKPATVGHHYLDAIQLAVAVPVVEGIRSLLSSSRPSTFYFRDFSHNLRLETILLKRFFSIEVSWHSENQ